MARQAQSRAAREESAHDEETGEILDRAPLREGPVAVVQFGGRRPNGFKVVKHVSVPMLEVPPGQCFVAQFIEKVRELPALLDENGKPRKQRFAGPHFASTIRADNGEVRLFTWTTVFRNEMEKNYPDDAYLNKWFQITRLPVKRGVDYSTYSITELELEAA